MGLLGCSTPSSEEVESTKSTVSHQFFEQSTRRDASGLEAQRVARTSTGCTAFFLENTAGKVYMASARHCFEYSVTNWCEKDGGITDNDGVEFKCTKVIAADSTHDITVFETNHPSHRTKGATTLRLASFNPSSKQRLIMTGYPCDEDPVEGGRQCALTTTESCWTLGSDVASPHTDDTTTLDRSFHHNCTTYGGNSGGPMYAEGTRDVIGLPFTYHPDDYNRYSSTDITTAAFLALTSDFVSVHKTELVSAGITLSTKLTKDGMTADPPDVEPETNPDPDAPADTSADTPEEPGDPAADIEPAGEDEAPKKSKSTKKSSSSKATEEDDESTDASTAPAPAAGGCSSAGGSAGNGWFAALLAVATLLATRRRR